MAAVTKYMYELLEKDSQETYKKDKLYRKWVLGIYILSTISIILLIVSQFNHMYYDFDARNFYYRKGFFWFSQMPGIIGMIVDAIIIFVKRRKLSKMDLIALSTYIIFPIVALLFQLVYYGISLLNLSIIVAIFFMFLSFLVEGANRMLRQQKELHETQIAVMISQIQPHFMFNSLSTIRYLCRVQPEQAIEAIDEFSGVLRGEVDAITMQKCTTVSHELELVKNYLNLEKRRFGDKLRVTYDINSEHFLVPAFSIQPIVENAVKHGLRTKIDGGSITIKTYETTDSYCVEVDDDGVGFDVNETKDDGRTHVGVQNVRSRVQMMCHGEVEINSISGRGTTVIIKIPKLSF